MRISSLTKEGVPELWNMMLEYQTQSLENGSFFEIRQKQHVVWMWSHIKDEIMAVFLDHPLVKERLERIKNQVAKGAITPGLAADTLLKVFVTSFESLKAPKDDKSPVVHHEHSQEED